MGDKSTDKSAVSRCVRLRMVYSAQWQHLHTFVYYVAPVAPYPHSVYVMKLGTEAAHTALLRHKAMVYVVRYIVRKIFIFLLILPLLLLKRPLYTKCIRHVLCLKSNYIILLGYLVCRLFAGGEKIRNLL